MAIYNKSSPWYLTSQNSMHLELLEPRAVPSESDDMQYTISSVHRHRPDLLAFDLYDNAKLWWVFMQRNMDVIKDPIYDFEIGTVIFLPKKSNLTAYIGV